MKLIRHSILYGSWLGVLVVAAILLAGGLGFTPGLSARAAAPSGSITSPAAPGAVNIVATKRDALQTDVDGDGKADPGDTLRYTVGITNTGTTSATLAAFNDTLDANTSLVAGSVKVSPLAFDDSFSTVGHTLLVVGVAAPASTPAVQVGGSLFSNDTEFLGDTFSLSTFQATSANGGTVSVNADGSFTYLPAVNFAGTDTFTYTIIDSSGLTGTATVSISVANKVWYVNNAAGTNGDGRSTSPFNTLTNINGAGGSGDADGPNDIIYLHTGSGNYTGGLPLESGQTLIGQGVALVVGGFTLNSAGTRPTITNSGGDAITLNSNNTISGLNVTTGGAALFGIKSLASSVGNLTINNASISGAGQPVDITNGGALNVVLDSVSTTSSNNRGINLDSVTGTFTVNGGSLAGINGSDVRINGGTVTFSYSGTINNSSNRSVEITSMTGGSATFSGTITDTGTGISVQNNTGGSTTFSGATKTLNTGANTAVTLATNTGHTINFTNGGLDIDTTSGTGFLVSGGGTVNVSGSNNSITATAGKAMDVSGVTAALTFATLSSTNSTTTGVSLNNVSGSLTTGSTTVSNPTGMGISVGSSSATLNFANTSVSGSGDTGVSLTSNSGGITFADLDITPDTSERALHATSNTGTLTVTSGTISTTSNTAVEITGVSSGSRTPLTVQLTSVSANGGPHGIFLQNTNGTFAVVGTTSGFCGGNVNTGTDPFTITAPNTADCTGGQIQNTVGSDTDPTTNPAGTGVRLNNATGVSLTRMWIHDHPNYAILGVGVSGFTLNDSLVNGTNGTNGATPFQEASVYFLEVTGTNSMTRVTVSGGRQDNVHIENTTGTLTSFTISNNQIQNNSTSTDGNIGYHVMSRTTANMTVTLQNSWLQGNRTDTINTDAADSSTLNTSIINNTIVAGTVGNNQGNLGIDVTASASAQVTFLVDSNRVGTKDNAMTAGNKSPLMNTGINVFDGTAASSNMTGKVINNKVQNDDVSIPSGTSNGFGIRVFNSNFASMSVNVTGNRVRGINTDYGILAESSGTLAAPASGRGLLAIGVINNDVRVGSNAIDDIRLQARNFNSICARVTGNDTGTGGTGFVGLFLRQVNSAVFNLEGGTGNLAANNPAADTTGFTGVITTVANGTCNTIPTAPARPTGNSFHGSSAGASVQSPVAIQAAYTVAGHVDRITGQKPERANVSYSGAKVTLASYSSLRSVKASVGAAPNDTVSVNIGTLPNGGKRVLILFDATIVSAPIPAGLHSVSNQGTASGSGFSVLTDDPDTAAPNDPTVTLIDAAPDLFVTKSDGGISVRPGDPITYTLSYSNVGTQGATGVVLTDTVPANTTFNPAASSPGWTCVPNNNAGSVCTKLIGGMAGGATGTAQYGVYVNVSLTPPGTTITNTASIGDDLANGAEPVTSNNTATETTPVNTATGVVWATGLDGIGASLAAPGLYWEPSSPMSSTRISTGGNSGVARGITATGAVLWTQNLGAAIQNRAPVIPISNTNVLFFTSQDGYVNALRANDGSSFWPGGGRKIGNSAVAGVAYQPNVPVLITGTTSLIFAGTFHDTTPPNNQFVALNALTGAPVWNFGGTLTATMGLLPTSPAAHWQSNTVFFGTKAPTTGSGVGAVWAVDTTTGLAKWVNTSIGSVVNSAPSLSQDGQTLYIGTVNGSTFTLYALRTIDGTVRASFTAPGGVGDFRGAPWVWPNSTNPADSDIYATAGDRIYGFTDTNATTGTLPFKSGWATGYAPVPGASTPILVPNPFLPAPGALYASGNNATVYKINLADGTIASTTVLGSSTAAVSELSFDRVRSVFYLTYNGAIYSLNLTW
ncbi:MAG TPA: Ig-like domain-containing protein [Chloroflexia bacterium]|jgi:uncharacterized repeat protein (TIGR01451 family)